MTMPNGASGLDDGSFLADWINQNNASQLATRTQDAITTYYKGQVQDSASWQSASEQFFTNLLGGFGDLGKFLGLVVQAVSGTPGSLADLQQFFTDRWNDLTSAVQGFTNMLEAFGQTTLQGLTDAWNGLVTATGNAADWVARLINDVLTLLDVFHLSHSKSEWNAAWDDLLTLMGIVHNTAKPVLAAPTFGDEIANAKAAASQASTDAASATAAAGVATSHVQSVVDGINEAITGSSTPGTSVDDIKTNMTAIPQGNIKIDPNVGGVVPVAFGVAGGIGFTAAKFSGSKTFTFSQNVTSDANYVLMHIAAHTDRAAPPQFGAITVGGVALDNLGVAYSGTNPYYYFVYGGFVPAGDSSLVVVPVSNQGSASVLSLACSTVTYANVRDVGSAVTIVGQANSSSFVQQLASMPEAGAMYSLSVATFGAVGVDVSGTSSSWGSLRTDTGTSCNGSDGAVALTIVDGPAVPSPNVSMSLAGAATFSLAIAVPMTPDVTLIGSAAVLSRRSNSSVAYPNAQLGMPLGFYDQVNCTPDMTPIVSVASPNSQQVNEGCSVQVSLAGDYCVSGSVGFDLLTSAGKAVLSAGGMVYPALILNGSVVQLGSPVFPIQSSGSYAQGTICVSGTFTEYLNIDDRVGFGLVYLGSGGAWNTGGLTVGRPVISWFAEVNWLRVALQNRSLH